MASELEAIKRIYFGPTRRGGGIIFSLGFKDHLHVDTQQDNKNVRINSRDYPGTTGDSSGVQIKPNRSVTGTAGVTGLEVSPRFAAGIAGAALVGIKVDPLLKAGSGNISGSPVGVQTNIDFGISGTRTITGDVSGFEAFLAIPSTYPFSSGGSSMLASWTSGGISSKVSSGVSCPVK